MPDLALENLHGRERGLVIAGTDEAGRGPLAGPVVAAAVIFPFGAVPDALASAINDSKVLSAKKRDALFPLITAHCTYAIAEASAEEIDRLNILQASLLAMRRAVEALAQAPAVVLVDGNKAPLITARAVPVVKGDSKSLSIAAASILAKVTRDRIMAQLHAAYPDYGWLKNAGYPTADHLIALEIHGITPHHRRSFGPVKGVAQAQPNEG